jgi:hypothetical protein
MKVHQKLCHQKPSKKKSIKEPVIHNSDDSDDEMTLRLDDDTDTDEEDDLEVVSQTSCSNISNMDIEVITDIPQWLKCPWTPDSE